MEDFNKDEITYYTYYVGRKEKNYKPETKKLVWNVFEEDWNGKRIRVYNVFDHGRFFNDLIKIKRKYKEFDEFAEEVRRSLQYYFWSKSEWEIILTDWPPHVDGEEIDRLVKEREERINRWGNFHLTDVRLYVAEKVDVFDQVMLNWDNFIKYIWENKKLIKKEKNNEN